MANVFALLVLAIWPIVTVSIFRRLPVARALIWSILLGYLALPGFPAGFDFPLLPPLDKMSIPPVAILLAMVFIKHEKIKWLPHSTLVRVLLGMVLLGPFLTVWTNGEPLVFVTNFLRGLWFLDGIALGFSQAMIIAPFLLARQFLRTEESHRDLLLAIAIGGLVYSIPILVEVRISPQLNYWIYGFYPGAFEQTIRAGGFRPTVFLQHGIWVAFFAMLSATCALAVWRNDSQKRTRWLLPLTVYLLGIAVLCKTLSPLIYAAFLLPMFMWAGLRLQLRVACVLAALTIAYPVLKSADLVPTETILQKAAAISPERAESLRFRLENEDQLLERAFEKPAFGWGTWGRNHIRNPYNGNIESIADGLWTLTLGIFGWVGFLGQFGLLAIPIFFLTWQVFLADNSVRSRQGRIRALKIPAPPREERTDASMRASAYCGVMALMLGVNMIDLLPNATLTPLTWLIAGALLGHAEHIAAERSRAKQDSHIDTQLDREQSPDRPRTII